MESIWMGIAPSPQVTRVLAMAGPNDTILKAQLARDPQHPRALATLLEAVALWQGLPVRAALCTTKVEFLCEPRRFFRNVWISLRFLAWREAVWLPSDLRNCQLLAVN